MRDRRRTKSIAAGIMGFMVLVFVLFSVLFVAHEIGHDCDGEECPVCACIAQCRNTLRQMGEGAVSQSAVVLPMICLLVSVCCFVCFFTQKTPVTGKVRMNN